MSRKKARKQKEKKTAIFYGSYVDTSHVDFSRKQQTSRTQYEKNIEIEHLNNSWKIKASQLKAQDSSNIEGNATVTSEEQEESGWQLPSEEDNIPTLRFDMNDDSTYEPTNWSTQDFSDHQYRDCLSLASQFGKLNLNEPEPENRMRPMPELNNWFPDTINNPMSHQLNTPSSDALIGRKKRGATRMMKLVPGTNLDRTKRFTLFPDDVNRRGINAEDQLNTGSSRPIGSKPVCKAACKPICDSFDHGLTCVVSGKRFPLLNKHLTQVLHPDGRVEKSRTKEKKSVHEKAKTYWEKKATGPRLSSLSCDQVTYVPPEDGMFSGKSYFVKGVHL